MFNKSSMQSQKSQQKCVLEFFYWVSKPYRLYYNWHRPTCCRQSQQILLVL